MVSPPGTVVNVRKWRKAKRKLTFIYVEVPRRRRTSLAKLAKTLGHGWKKRLHREGPMRRDLAHASPADLARMKASSISLFVSSRPRDRPCSATTLGCIELANAGLLESRLRCPRCGSQRVRSACRAPFMVAGGVRPETRRLLLRRGTKDKRSRRGRGSLALQKRRPPSLARGR